MELSNTAGPSSCDNGNSTSDAGEVVYPSTSGTLVYYCNVTERWDDESHTRSFLFIVVPVVLAALLTVGCWVLAFRKSTWNVFCTDWWTLRHECPGCCRCSKKWFFALFGVTTFILGELLEIFDVFTDADMYVTVYSGKELDSNFYRNDHVMNAMFVFTCTGVLSIPLTIYMKNRRGRSSKRGEPGTFKSSTAKLLTFLLEDAPETLLQYFYVEKYVVDGTLPTYKVLCVIGKIVKECFAMVDIVRRFRRSETCGGRERAYVILTAVLHLMIMVMNVLRVCAAFNQLITGTLDARCAAVDEHGRLTQTPFTPGCLNEVDIALLAFIAVTFIGAAWFVAGYFRVNDVLRMKEGCRRVRYAIRV